MDCTTKDFAVIIDEIYDRLRQKTLLIWCSNDGLGTIVVGFLSESIIVDGNLSHIYAMLSVLYGIHDYHFAVHVRVRRQFTDCEIFRNCVEWPFFGFFLGYYIYTLQCSHNRWLITAEMWKLVADTSLSVNNPRIISFSPSCFVQLTG